MKTARFAKHIVPALSFTLGLAVIAACYGSIAPSQSHMSDKTAVTTSSTPAPEPSAMSQPRVVVNGQLVTPGPAGSTHVSLPSGEATVESSNGQTTVTTNQGTSTTSLGGGDVNASIQSSADGNTSWSQSQLSGSATGSSWSQTQTSSFTGVFGAGTADINIH